MAKLRLGRVSSPLGPVWVAESEAGVAACSLSDSPDGLLADLQLRYPGQEAEPADLDAAWLWGDGAPRLDLAGVRPFDARVYEIVRSVPRGETVTYGDVAALVGSPRAARAVGGAMSRCPFFPAVPCHRVVRASDGWSGWGGDPLLKRRLLAAERAAPEIHRTSLTGGNRRA